MKNHNFLTGFFWNKILSDTTVEVIDQKIVETHTFNLQDELYNIDESNLTFEPLKIKIEQTLLGEVKINAFVNFSLSKTSYEDYAIDAYNSNVEPFFKALSMFLSAKPVKMTFNSFVSDDSVVYDAKLVAAPYTIFDFDCVDSEDGGYDFEEVKAILLDFGAILNKYDKCGVGGGNPQYFAYFPSKESYFSFIKFIYKYTDEEAKEFVEL